MEGALTTRNTTKQTHNRCETMVDDAYELCARENTMKKVVAKMANN